MYGSASVIGLQMLPILEPVAPEAGARARALGEAFQMSNVGEDLPPELLHFEISRSRALYAFAEPGIDMLHPTSRDCVRTASVLYGEILTPSRPSTTGC